MAWRFVSKVGKYFAPAVLGYEVNEFVKEDQIVQYVPVVHEIIEKEQREGLVKDVLIVGIVVFVMVIFSIKFWLKIRKNRNEEAIQMRNL